MYGQQNICKDNSLRIAIYVVALVCIINTVCVSSLSCLRTIIR